MTFLSISQLILRILYFLHLLQHFVSNWQEINKCIDMMGKGHFGPREESEKTEDLKMNMTWPEI